MPVDESTYGTVIHHIYSTALRPERWPATLDLASGYFNAAGANVLFALSNGAPRLLCSTTLAAPNSVYFAEGWFEHDIVAHRLREHYWAGELFYTRASDLIPQDELEALPIMSGFYRRFGLGRLASFNIVGATGGPGISSLACCSRLHRRRNGRDECNGPAH